MVKLPPPLPTFPARSATEAETVCGPSVRLAAGVKLRVPVVTCWPSSVMAAVDTFTPVSASVALKEMEGRAEVVKPPLGGCSSCTTGAMISTVKKVKLNGEVCTLPLRSVAWLTTTLKLPLFGNGAAGVKTAWVGVFRTALPAIAPPGPVTTIRSARLALADSGSEKFTVIVVFPGT
jgi:hypothetical protein